MDNNIFCPSCGEQHAKLYPYCSKISKDSPKSLMKMELRGEPKAKNFMKDYVLFFEYTEKNSKGELMIKKAEFAFLRDKQLAEQIVTRYNYFIQNPDENKETEAVPSDVEPA